MELGVLCVVRKGELGSQVGDSTEKICLGISEECSQGLSQQARGAFGGLAGLWQDYMGQDTLYSCSIVISLSRCLSLCIHWNLVLM